MGKRKQAAAQTFATRDECNEAIRMLGIAQRELQRVEADMNESLAKIKEASEARAKPYAEQVAYLVTDIWAWCDANRAELTDNDKVKTVKFGNGEVAWREAPPKVSINKKTKAEGVVAWLLEAPAKFRKFLRPKHELNKEAMLAAPELAAEIPGVTIKSAGEGFYIKPFETELEEAL